MSIPPPQAPTLGDRLGGTKTMRGPLSACQHAQKQACHVPQFAYPFFYNLDINRSKMTFHVNCS